MIFWRVFMRISYSCPTHLKFGLTVEQWSALVQLTGDAIDWLDRHDNLYDVWMLVAYAATSCALVQVCLFPHTWLELIYGTDVFDHRIVPYMGETSRPGGSAQAEEAA